MDPNSPANPASGTVSQQIAAYENWIARLRVAAGTVMQLFRQAAMLPQGAGNAIDGASHEFYSAVQQLDQLAVTALTGLQQNPPVQPPVALAPAGLPAWPDDATAVSFAAAWAETKPQLQALETQLITSTAGRPYGGVLASLISAGDMLVETAAANDPGQA
ncbi:hypothetical protein IP92_01455 [Pseudoduganella flava]|uniref:Uncharacterized protein n=1 Tax=Pseudoduganella flava TaxID=871742 RepID=A0A562Q1M8_9BURK|nr:hypothetical protein [Pseudoduganella flava]QGZ38242.1 hypothetical protein GO485_03705 [Pseudoduganella flava]TWI50226.1 hypothetical protein IP92_01455 [Pseudoduganella flava]